MLKVRLRFAATAAVCIVAAACSKSSSPTQPSTTAAAGADGATATASVTVPRAVSPAAGVTIRNTDQPVTLVVANAVITQSAAATYTFEVSTDSAFSSKAYSKTGVAAGASGQTSLTIDKIPAGTNYYWHARAEGGGTVGPFSAARPFTIGPAIVIDSATLVSPISGAGTGARPTFTVTNATRSGPAGPISYKFEIASSSAFSPVLVTGAVNEGVSRTTYTPNTDLPPETTLYWRVTASDVANGVSGPTTLPATFVTSFAIDLKKVVYLNSPDVSGWPQTAVLSLVEQDGGGDGPVCMSYTDPAGLTRRGRSADPIRTSVSTRISGTSRGSTARGTAARANGSIAARRLARLDKARRRSDRIQGSVRPSAAGCRKSVSSSASWCRRSRATVP